MKRRDHAESPVIQGSDRIGLYQAAGCEDRPRSLFHLRDEAAGRPYISAVGPAHDQWIGPKLTGDGSREDRARCRDVFARRDLVDGPRASLGLDNESDLNGKVYSASKNRTVAADLLGENLSSLGFKVPLDEQRDGTISTPNAGERVGTQVAVEELGARTLRGPAADAFSEQRVAGSHERCEQIVRRELVDGSRRR